MNPGTEFGADGRFRGLSVASVTPFDADGRVDADALAAHVRWMVDEGVDVVMPCGTTGEGATLSPDEQRRVTAVCMAAVGDRARVVVGASHYSTATVQELVRAARDEGAHGVLCATPPYNRPSQRGLVAHFEALAEAGRGLPIVLYNVPSRTGVNLRAETVLELAELEPIVGVKEASGDLDQVMEILRRRPEGFGVLAGDDVLTLVLAALGGDGVVSVTANEAPGAMARLVAAALAGRLEEARREHFRLLPLFRANFVETNPVPVKTALARMGRMDARFRLPLVGLSPESERTLERALAEAGVHGGGEG